MPFALQNSQLFFKTHYEATPIHFPHFTVATPHIESTECQLNWAFKWQWGGRRGFNEFLFVRLVMLWLRCLRRDRRGFKRYELRRVSCTRWGSSAEASRCKLHIMLSLPKFAQYYLWRGICSVNIFIKLVMKVKQLHWLKDYHHQITSTGQNSIFYPHRINP